MHYLDHAATTPMRPAAITAMTAELSRSGNPSSPHTAGRAARAVVEDARESIAAAYGVDPVEVVFTSGGTEADNLAVTGIYRARSGADPTRRRVIASPVEHHAVLDTVRALARTEGAQIDWLPVDADGVVDPADLDRLLQAGAPSTALVTVMTANNETGVLQPIAALTEIARRYGVPLHTDAVQAAATGPADLGGVDAATVTAHKLGGPVGIGALLVGRTTPIQAIAFGGGQERDLRSGTLDAPAAAGFAAAVDELADRHLAEAAGTLALRDALIAGIRRVVPDAVPTAEPAARLPGIAHLTFPGCGGDELLLLLDAAGVACSTGSACTTGVSRPSHVLEAMGVPADGALRFSFGHDSTAADVTAAVAAIGPAVQRARAARQVAGPAGRPVGALR